jgi:hypothetical protein
METFKKLIVSSFKDYEEAENSQVRLGAALRATGQYSKEALNSFLLYANGIQQTSIFTHEAVESSASLLATIAHLRIDGIETLMPRLMDFAAMYGIGLPEAARMAAAAIEGGRNQFMRFGINIKEAHDPASRFSALMEALEKNVNGVADAMAANTYGKITILKNQLKELGEEFGKIMADVIGPTLAGGVRDFRIKNILNIDPSTITNIKEAQSAIVELAKRIGEMAPENRKHPLLANISGDESYVEAMRAKMVALAQAVERLKAAMVPSQGQGSIIDQTPHANVYVGITQLDVATERFNRTLAAMDEQWNALGIFHAKDKFAEVDSLISKINIDTVAFSNVMVTSMNALFIGKTAEDLKKQSKELSDTWKQIADSAVQFGESLAKGDFAGALKGLVNMLGQLLMTAGARIIAEQGTLGLPVGIALLAAGGLVLVGGSVIGSGSSGSWGGGSTLPHMAAGGIAMGPTLALIGESGPEAVVPLGRGMGGTTINVYGSVWSERDLASVVAASARHW